MKLNDIRNFSKDDLLAALGLQTRTSAISTVFGSIGLIGLGMVIGAGAALMMAPKSGRELREDLEHPAERHHPAGGRARSRRAERRPRAVTRPAVAGKGM